MSRINELYSQTSNIEQPEKTTLRELREIRAFLKALELLGAFKQEPVKKGVTRQDLEEARKRHKRRFGRGTYSIKGAHPASTKYIREANAGLESACEYLDAAAKMQTSKQNIEKDPYIYK